MQTLPTIVREKIHIMKSKLLMMLSLLTCAGNQQVVDSAVNNSECLQPIVDGTYDLVFETLSTKCGSVDDLRLNVFYGVPSPQENAGCHLVKIRNRNKSCDVGATFHCDDGLWKMIMVWNTISHTTDSNKISGVLDVEMKRFTGWTCEGTYSYEGNREIENR